MNEKTLFQALADAPDDEGARVVFADWLIEQGDPMAEFLTLQLAHRKKKPDLLQAQRAQDLLIMNWKRWVGALHRVLQRRASAFEGGLLRDATAGLSKSEPTEPLRAAPQWATVRQLNITGEASVGDVLESPWLRNLKHLECSPEALAGRSGCAFSLDTLALTGGATATVDPSAAWSQLQRLTLRQFQGRLSAVRLTAREVHCEVVALDGATIKLVREAVRLDARPEQLRVACYGTDFTITRGSEVVKAEMTVRNDEMRDAIRQLGTIELELTYGARTYGGRARDFNWS